MCVCARVWCGAVPPFSTCDDVSSNNFQRQADDAVVAVGAEMSLKLNRLRCLHDSGVPPQADSSDVRFKAA